MGAAIANVLINISAKDLASAVFKQIGTDVKSGLGKATKGLEKYQASLEETGKAATKLGKNMSIGVTAPLVAFGGIALNSAVKADRLTKTLTGLAGGAEEAASFIDAIKSASLGTIPQIQALEIANSALSFGVVETEEGMASLVETAIVLGKAQGLDAATAVGDLTTALARQSPMILDNLGITLKMSEASLIAAENASAFGFEADNLTKAQEFQIAAMVKGREAAARMGGMQEDMATKVERSKAQVSDMSTTLGASLIPKLETVLDVFTPVITAFNNMDPATQEVVAGLSQVAAGVGPAMAAFGTFTTVISKVPVAMTKAKAAMVRLKAAALAMNPALIGVAATIGALVVVGKVYSDQQKEINKATDEAVKVASSWSDKAQDLINDGGSLGDTLSTLANKQNTVSKAWNDNVVTGTAIGGIFNANAKISKVYAETQDQVNKIIVKNSSNFGEYVSAVSAYNAEINDAAAKTKILTEAQFNMASIMEKGASDASLLADSIFQQNNAYVDTDEITRERLNISERQAEADAESTMTARDLMLATEDLTAADTASIETRFNALSTSREILDAREQEAIGAEEAAAKTAAAAERVTTHQDRAAASAQLQAEALEASRQAALGAAEAQVALAGSLLEATDAQIASALIEQLDPEQLGATAYAEGVTAIQTAFGLADEKSIALSQNLGPLADAMNTGIISAENFDEALAALVQDAEDGEVNTGALMDQFAKAPGLIGPSKDALENLNEKLEITAELALTAADSVSMLETALTGAGNAAGSVPIPGGGGPDRFQFGGVVPGPIGGAPRLVMAEPGEEFTPPSQVNGPTNNFGGNTQTVIINNEAALGFFEEQQRQDRLSRLTANL